jgi:hypothetical protein
MTGAERAKLFLAVASVFIFLGFKYGDIRS